MGWHAGKWPERQRAHRLGCGCGVCATGKGRSARQTCEGWKTSVDHAVDHRHDKAKCQHHWPDDCEFAHLARGRHAQFQQEQHQHTEEQVDKERLDFCEVILTHFGTEPRRVSDRIVPSGEPMTPSARLRAIRP